MRRRVKGACAPYGHSGPKKENSVLRRQVSISKRAGAARKRLAMRNQSLSTPTFVVDSTDGDMDMGDEETESDVPDIVHTAPMFCPAVLSAHRTIGYSQYSLPLTLKSIAISAVAVMYYSLGGPF